MSLIICVIIGFCGGFGLAAILIANDDRGDR